MPQLRDEAMPHFEFKALQESLEAASRNMSRDQMIDLADQLFEHSRERREQQIFQPISISN